MRRGGTYVVVLAAFLGDHADSHVEAVEEDAGGSEGQLRELQQDASLYDEVDAFRPATALIDGHHSVKNGGGARELGFSEEPLIRAFESHLGCGGQLFVSGVGGRRVSQRGRRWNGWGNSSG